MKTKGKLTDFYSISSSDVSSLNSTFIVIFLAELGDKTQLAVMTQTCQYRSPLPVFLGAVTGLVSSTAVGVIGGRTIHQFIPLNFIQWIAAFLFLVLGIVMLRATSDRDNEKHTDDSQCLDDVNLKQMTFTKWNFQVFLTTFSLLFLAELGDKTQLAIVGMASQHQAILPVFVGGSLALIGSTAIAVVLGKRLFKHFDQIVLTRLSGSVFIIMGIVLMSRLLGTIL